MEEELRRLKEENEALKSENEKLMKIVSVFDTARKNELQGKLNHICDSLKGEWKDFQDALDMELEPTIFECLKIQIKNIFRILKKEGADVEAYVNKYKN